MALSIRLLTALYKWTGSPRTIRAPSTSEARIDGRSDAWRSVGSGEVAREILARGRPFAPLGRPAIVNGAVGIVVGSPDRPFAIAGCTIADGRVVELDLILDREKLAAVSVS